MTQTRDLVLMGLFAAMVAALGLLPKVTLGFGVPITAQTMGVMLPVRFWVHEGVPGPWPSSWCWWPSGCPFWPEGAAVSEFSRARRAASLWGLS